ncbi:MAG: rhodanese-related sulfurtransferase, partial [Pseudomonadota bacterium]
NRAGVMTDALPSFTVLALYRFVDFERFESFQIPLLDFCKKHGLKGTLLIAKEGLNGTIAGSSDSIAEFLNFLRQQPEFVDIDGQYSHCEKPPFLRMKVKLKQEIVSLGVDTIDPKQQVGIYVQPEEWNQLIANPDTLIIDTRNRYEFDIGTFSGAINPETDAFREFPEFEKKHLAEHKDKPIAMFCTGGIRCEKATSFLLSQGYNQVYHLKGGILNYLANVKTSESLWQGECFVFDERVTVDHHVQPGTYDMCHACRYPITEADKLSDDYKPGVSCPHCIGQKNSEQLQRYTERQKQMQLAKDRQTIHLGAVHSSFTKPCLTD